MVMTLKRASIASGALCAMVAGATAQAESMRIAHGYPAKSIIGATYEHLAAYVEANTEIEAEVFALTLLDLKQASSGLTAGVADATLLLTPYFPNEFSETNFAADLTMAANIGGAPTSVGAAIGGAVMEYVTMNCPECVAQNVAQNQIYLATAPGTQFGLLCREPMRSLDDVSGKVLRAATDTFRRWGEAVGATASSISGNEIYDALSQGLIDCTVNAAGELSNFSLFDVVGGVTPGMPGGTFGGSSVGQFNLDFWTSLTPEQRQILARGAADTAAFMITEYVKQEQRDLATAKEKGIEVVEPAEDLSAATAAFIQNDIETIKTIYAEKYGLSNVDEKAETFLALVQKWKTLTADLDPSDRGALSELFWTEVLSKLDLETYGQL